MKHTFTLRWIYMVIAAVCILNFLPLMVFAKSYGIIGAVLTTDICAYVNGAKIPAYNVDGNMVIVGSDLRRYGFDVVYDNNSRTSSVTYSGNGVWDPIFITTGNDGSVGRKVMDVYDTDITVYVNGMPVTGYNVDGHMAFKFSELKTYGEYYYDNGTRTTNLWIGMENDDTWESTIPETDKNSVDSDNSKENIYIDQDGSLIIILADGSIVNVNDMLSGKDGTDGTDGKDGINGFNGRDGVSVVNAYVDASGNLMIALSSGRMINAGNVGAGGNTDKLSFADYSVGTKFFLTEPTGSFDMVVNVDGFPYVVEFGNAYYELTAKNHYNDEDAWVNKDGETSFIPYEVTMYIEGQTDRRLAGRTLSVILSEIENHNWSYTTDINIDGSFSVAFTQGLDNSNVWYSPKSLVLKRVSVSEESSRPSDSESEENDVTSELLVQLMGKWMVPYEPDKVIVFNADGSISDNGIYYKPTYRYTGMALWVTYGGKTAVFYVDENMLKCEGDYYYKDGICEVISLTSENFFTYYEYEESFTIHYNAFGEFEKAVINFYYVLKDEYKINLDISNAAIKKQTDWYLKQYTIDFNNESYSTSEPGEAGGTYISTENSDRTLNFALESITLLPNNTQIRFPQFQCVDATGTLYLLKN